LTIEADGDAASLPLAAALAHAPVAALALLPAEGSDPTSPPA
jgi:hypothetical protein